jgi:hypothetical protein
MEGCVDAADRLQLVHSSMHGRPEGAPQAKAVAARRQRHQRDRGRHRCSTLRLSRYLLQPRSPHDGARAQRPNRTVGLTQVRGAVQLLHHRIALPEELGRKISCEAAVANRSSENAS